MFTPARLNNLLNVQIVAVLFILTAKIHLNRAALQFSTVCENYAFLRSELRKWTLLTQQLPKYKKKKPVIYKKREFFKIELIGSKGIHT